MSNDSIIRDFIRGNSSYGAYSHLAYKGNKLFNYSTELLELDRENKIANFNTRKYSRTTSKIQNNIEQVLKSCGYTIKKYEGNPCTYWNCGYEGAEKWTVKEVKEW